MRNVHHLFWVKFTYLFLAHAQPLFYWHSFRPLGWEALLILKAGKYGKKFSAPFGKSLGPMRVPRIKGDGLQSPAEKM
jgi:hypothetical protein